MAKKAARAYRYTGDGSAFLEGVPARDLTEEDVATLTDEQKEAVEASDLYEAAAAKPKEDDADAG